MGKLVFGLAMCLTLSACGSSSGSSGEAAANAPMPPECESYFKRLAQCKGPGEKNTPEAAAAEFEQYRKAWNPSDPQQMTVEQCRTMDQTMAAGGNNC